MDIDETRITFTFGIPKSGTTWLQMILDAHPDIVCPSEHQFDYFVNRIPELLTEYNELLVRVDHKTARQGPTFFQDGDARGIVRAIIITAVANAARKNSVRYYALNDNAIIGRMDFYGTFFPNSKFLCIVRDPRDVVVSTWAHNLRVEKDFLARAKDIRTWSGVIGELWQKQMTEIHKLNSESDLKITFVRYEDLVEDKVKAITKILDFIGADTSSLYIDACIQATDFNSLAAADQVGSRNPFFRKGVSGNYASELEDECQKVVVQAAKDAMDLFGYSA
mgnify:FL=1